MRLLQTPRTLNLMNLTFAPFQKVNLNPADADLLKLTAIALLMQKFTQQDQIRISLQSQIMRKKPQFTNTNKKIINLRTSKRKAV